MRVFRLTILFAIAAVRLLAAPYDDAETRFGNGDYTGALKGFEEAAAQGDRGAFYRLGEMYEKGLGVAPDPLRAMQYYKASSTYFVRDTPAVSPAAASETETAAEETEMRQFILSKIDPTDADARSFLERYIDSDFGLYAYKTNYFLPYSLASSPYFHWSEAGIVNGNATYEHPYEAEFQISLKKPLSFDLLGLKEAITFAYTQKVWWQIYGASGPFRETNYEPEVFITFPSPESLDLATGLKGLRLGFVHESNGRGGLQSRSWNRLYLGTLWQHGNLFTNFRLWYRIPESRKKFPLDSGGDDNPEICRYVGYGDINFSYIYGEHRLGLMVRNNFHLNGENRGAVMLDWSYPLPYSEHTFWYVKLFSGYGESLIDYDRHVNKASFGLSFSRGVF